MRTVHNLWVLGRARDGRSAENEKQRAKLRKPPREIRYQIAARPKFIETAVRLRLERRLKREGPYVAYAENGFRACNCDIGGRLRDADGTTTPAAATAHHSYPWCMEKVVSSSPRWPTSPMELQETEPCGQMTRCVSEQLYVHSRSQASGGWGGNHTRRRPADEVSADELVRSVSIWLRVCVCACAQCNRQGVSREIGFMTHQLQRTQRKI